MSDVVKDKPNRAEKTRLTRRRIVAAAADLFLDQGYGATTLDQVAARAGVAVQTVYFHYGNKATLLKEALDVAAVGADQPVARIDRTSSAAPSAPTPTSPRSGTSTRPSAAPRSACWPTCSPTATRSAPGSPSKTPL